MSVQKTSSIATTSPEAVALGAASVEKTVRVRSGWPMLLLTAVATAVLVACIVAGAAMLPASDAPVATASEAAGVTLLAVGIVGICVVPLILLMGFFTIQPNQARVLILFGDYKGTVREEGFHWANPFYSRRSGYTNVDGKPAPRRCRCAPARTTASTSR